MNKVETPDKSIKSPRFRVINEGFFKIKKKEDTFRWKFAGVIFRNIILYFMWCIGAPLFGIAFLVVGLVLLLPQDPNNGCIRETHIGKAIIFLIISFILWVWYIYVLSINDEHPDGNHYPPSGEGGM